MEKNQELKFKTVDSYIEAAPERARAHLIAIRKILHQTVPEAAEVISYNMPAFKYHGILIYFAAHREHIGFYPANTSFLEVFQTELSCYKTSKGTIQFPIDQKLPVDLITRIIEFRAKQNSDKKNRNTIATKRL